MSNKLNISVLVAARDEYIDQLKCILCPLIIQGFNSIYQDANRLSNGRNIIYKFQELLKEIPRWNQTILQEESKRIKKKCQYIMDIVTAIFVSNVKILASIRLKGNNDNIKVKIPTCDLFVHSIYIESAQQFFYNPMLFNHRDTFNLQMNKRNIKEIIQDSIDESIRQMLPFDDILQEYLANALDDNVEDSESGSSAESDEDNELQGDRIIDEVFDDPPDSDANIVKNFNLPIQYPLTDPGPVPEPYSEPAPVPCTEQPFVPFMEPKPRSRSSSRSSSSSGSSSSSSSSSGSERSRGRHRSRHVTPEPRTDNKDRYSFF